jgi:hypothetical protein
MKSPETFISEPEHASKNSFPTVQSFHDGQINQKPLTKTALAGTRFFEASAVFGTLTNSVVR